MTAFGDVVSATPWRTDLLIATVDGVRIWGLSHGGVELVFPDCFSGVDIARFREWFNASNLARHEGKPSPSYLDFINPSLPRVPITADEMAFLVGFPPDGVNLQQIIDQDGVK